MRVSKHRIRGALLGFVTAAGVAVGAPACGNGTAPLPELLAARPDVPYIEGLITQRLDQGSTVRILVEASDRDARTPAAVVTVPADAMILRPDGAPVESAALTVGRAVTVWATGPEMRSLPPQVSAAAILVRR